MVDFNQNPWGSTNFGNTAKAKPKDNIFNLNFQHSPINPTKYIIYGVIGLFILWLLSGFYQINTNEEAAEFYFGKFYAVKDSGLNYCFPKPIGTVIILPTKTINKEEFGFRSNTKASTNIDNESIMLTGDENIVDIDFEVQWKIKDIKDFIFSLQNPTHSIRIASESAMREIIATRPINDVLSNKKSAIEFETKTLLQDILNNYTSGVEIILVQLLRVDPPQQVIDAFRDVQTAKADKERSINEAETYKNDILPKTRGEAEAIVKEAEAYKESLILDAKGESERFLTVYTQYRNNKELNKKRIYLETMEEIMKNIEKTIIDDSFAKNFLPITKLK